ncbi:MAG: hypothetical protein MJE77_12065 [Proteobacteria bacterium]|nr:hypothetical protein [Pseudomonadota bacterium]
MQTLGVVPAEWTASDIDGQAVFVVQNLQDVRDKWPLFLAGKPDFVKVFLLYSEQHDQRKDDPAYQYRRGIDPALVPAIVERARAAKLTVSAHVYTAADFRTAVDAGVDQIAHLPGIGYDEKLGRDRFRLTDEDALRAARQGVTVISTLTEFYDDMTVKPGLHEYFDDVIRSNFQKLRVAGVPVLIGSDQFRRTTDVEARALSRLGLYTNLELLQVWCVDTPRMIFPDRRIGSLEPAYEASFLVLEGNPLDHPSNTQRIALRVKSGHVLLPGNPPFPPLKKK